MHNLFIDGLKLNNSLDVARKKLPIVRAYLICAGLAGAMAQAQVTDSPLVLS